MALGVSGLFWEVSDRKGKLLEAGLPPWMGAVP
jgi:hypothetical protein